MEVRYNLWIEADGEVALSPWRVNLLKAIAATGSINAAAEKMKIPYRTAWQKVHEMETRLGVPLLHTHTGGPHGGGAELTDEAFSLIRKLERLSEVLSPQVQAAFKQTFEG